MSGASRNVSTGSSPSTGEWGEDEDLGAEISPLVIDAVGQALQAHFKAIADLPLPDRLMVLLAELEARERTS